MRVILLTAGAVLLLTCAVFFSYEFYSFRKSTIEELSTLAKIIAANSTASLAFENPEDAGEILQALKAQPHIVAASIYDKEGLLFCNYPSGALVTDFPSVSQQGFHFENSFLQGFQPIFQGERQLGTLYLKSDLKAMYQRFELYSVVVGIVVLVSFLFSFILSRGFQRTISRPIISLAETAKVISENKDYSVRATKLGQDELGLLTDAFNQMLTQIEKQNQELSEFSQKMEQKVTERTAELQAANKELESFSYTISHDLRAPLRTIHGFMNIFSEDYANKLDDEAKRLMGIIITNAKKMGQLIDDLLTFSRLGRQELVKVKVSMKDIAAAVCEEMRKSEPGREIDISLADLPDAYAEMGTIKQVWVNLISNAFKYTRKRDRAVIEINWKQENDSVIYSVKDNGTGFDMQYYHKLFGVFQRLHTERDFEGTGVGLAIVQRIIQRHGGKVWAEAKIDDGATFYFTLPKLPAVLRN